MIINPLLRKMLVSQRYMAPEDESGGGGGGGADKIAAALAAEKAAAEKAAAEKATAEAEAAEAERKRKEAAGGGSGDRKPTDEEAALLKEVMQKKGKLDEANKALTAAQEQLKKFDGIDPEAVRALLKEKTDAETAALEAKGEWSRLKERMADEHGKEKKTLQEQIDALKSQLGEREGVINELTIGTQFSQSQFIGSELALTPSKARVIYGEHFELVDGKIVGYDKPKGAAARTQIVNGAGVPLSFDEALKKIVEADPEKDHLLKSKVKPGAGSDSRAGGKVVTPTQQQHSETKGLSRIAAGLKGLNVKLNG
jgi:hypothetical protein